MNHHAPIQDHAQYNAEMSKSLPEKLFFLDKVKADVWVDFGCGDGSVLAEVRPAQPEAVLFGIEQDEWQRLLARNRGIVTYTGLRPIAGLHETGQGNTIAAIFSSVLHESPELLLQALDFGFDYIVIRDMALLRDWRHLERDLNAAFKYPYWGTPSWDREVGEDYFRLDALSVLAAPHGYRTIYFEHSPVLAIQDRIERDIGVRPDAPTHVKAIWKKVK